MFTAKLNVRGVKQHNSHAGGHCSGMYQWHHMEVIIIKKKEDNFAFQCTIIEQITLD